MKCSAPRIQAARIATTGHTFALDADCVGARGQRDDDAAVPLTRSHHDPADPHSIDDDVGDDVGAMTAVAVKAIRTPGAPS
jgi:hypothetical protein